MKESPKTSRRRTLGRALLATALLMTSVTMLSAAPSGAVAVSKTINATCKGKTPETQQLISQVLGGAINVPITFTGNVPASLEPDQADVPVDFSLKISLPQNLIDLAAGAVGAFTIKNAAFDIAVGGPTSTKVIPARPPARRASLTVGQPFSLQEGPFRGTLKDIGSSGTVRFSTTGGSFDVDADLLELGVACSIPGTIAIVPIKVPGSPDIAQIPDVESSPGTTEVIDVLGEYVTNGRTKDGVEQQVVPETLKIVDGPGAIEAGKVSIPSPAAGQSSTTTFEVCAAEVELAPAIAGEDETQRLTIDRSSDGLGPALKRPIAFTLVVDGEETTPISLAQSGSGQALSGSTIPSIETWEGPNRDGANGRWSNFTDFQDPSFAWVTSDPQANLGTIASDIKAAIEALPDVGVDDVAVSVSDPAATTPEFKIDFVEGKLSGRDLPPIEVGTFWSILPRGILDAIIAAAGDLAPDPNAPAGPPSPADPDQWGNADPSIAPANPDNPTPEEVSAAVLFFVSRSDSKFPADFQGFIDDRGLALEIELNGLLAGLDVNAALGAITGLFPKAPVSETLEDENGVDPTPAQIQELCSQGVITMVASTEVEAATDPTGAGPGGTGSGGAGTEPDAGLTFAG